MEVKAIHRGARISAQKTRLVADQIRGLPISRAAVNSFNFHHHPLTSSLLSYRQSVL